ncbi:MAG: hypothetical protein NXI18_19895 [Alphaproteobacteria bacterium]|nr:hypothetical protein [Alphaproteobacteria bacterium]
MELYRPIIDSFDVPISISNFGITGGLENPSGESVFYAYGEDNNDWWSVAIVRDEHGQPTEFSFVGEIGGRDRSFYIRQEETELHLTESIEEFLVEKKIYLPNAEGGFDELEGSTQRYSTFSKEYALAGEVGVRLASYFIKQFVDFDSVVAEVLFDGAIDSVGNLLVSQLGVAEGVLGAPEAFGPALPR